jgi:hypothetical protein
MEVRSITLSIWDEIDSGMTETCTIELQRNQSLFAILCAKRPNLRFWYNLKSLSSNSNLLNLHSFDNAQPLVDMWGQSLFEGSQPEPRMFLGRLVLGHHLRLTLNPQYPAVHVTPNKHRHMPVPRPHRMSRGLNADLLTQLQGLSGYEDKREGMRGTPKAKGHSKIFEEARQEARDREAQKAINTPKVAPKAKRHSEIFEATLQEARDQETRDKDRHRDAELHAGL